jgi:hypothetical protein
LHFSKQGIRRILFVHEFIALPLQCFQAEYDGFGWWTISNHIAQLPAGILDTNKALTDSVLHRSELSVFYWIFS